MLLAGLQDVRELEVVIRTILWRLCDDIDLSLEIDFGPRWKAMCYGMRREVKDTGETKREVRGVEGVLYRYLLQTRQEVVN